MSKWNWMKEHFVVGVVCGGKSSEAEVSRVSGQCIADALKSSFPKVELIELDTSIWTNLKDRVDVVFPALHGFLGEDGIFQGYLDMLNIPYAGNGVLASACAMDKIVAKRLFQSSGIPVAKDVVIYHSTSPRRTRDPRIGENSIVVNLDRPKEVASAAKRSLDYLGEDVVVKPPLEGSSLGVQYCSDYKSLAHAIEQTYVKFDVRVLIEERIKGREITVGIIERDQPEALPVIEILTPPDSWYDYQHRYTPGLSEHIIPARLPKKQYRRTQELAIAAHMALCCRDLSRVDFVVPERGEPIVLEVNTMPGMTPTSLYPDAANAYGISFKSLVKYLTERALLRKHEGVEKTHLEVRTKKKNKSDAE